MIITEKQYETAYNIFGENFSKFSNLRINPKSKQANSRDNLSLKYSIIASKSETNLEFRSEIEEASQILNQDCPERILKNLKFRNKIDEADLSDEVEWIGKNSKIKQLGEHLKGVLSNSNS